MVGLRLCFCVSVDTAPFSSHPSARWLRSLRCLRLGRRAPPHGQGICHHPKNATGGRNYAKASFTAHTLFLRTGMARAMKKPGLCAIAARAINTIFSVRADFFAPKFCGRAALPTAGPALHYLGVRRRHMVQLCESTRNDAACDVHLHQNAITIF